MADTAVDRLEYRRADHSVEYVDGRGLRMAETPDGLIEVSATVGDVRLAISYQRLAAGESIWFVRRVAGPTVN